jgi:hypothetical protein
MKSGVGSDEYLPFRSLTPRYSSEEVLILECPLPFLMEATFQTKFEPMPKGVVGIQAGAVQVVGVCGIASNHSASYLTFPAPSGRLSSSTHSSVELGGATLASFETFAAVFDQLAAVFDVI